MCMLQLSMLSDTVHFYWIIYMGGTISQNRGHQNYRFYPSIILIIQSPKLLTSPRIRLTSLTSHQDLAAFGPRDHIVIDE